MKVLKISSCRRSYILKGYGYISLLIVVETTLRRNFKVSNDAGRIVASMKTLHTRGVCFRRASFSPKSIFLSQPNLLINFAKLFSCFFAGASPPCLQPRLQSCLHLCLHFGLRVGCLADIFKRSIARYGGHRRNYSVGGSE